MHYFGRSENGITNGIEVFDSPQHGVCVLASNNDSVMRLLPLAGAPALDKPLLSVQFPWAVNYATMRPGSSLAAVVGDDPVTHLTDINRCAPAGLAVCVCMIWMASRPAAGSSVLLLGCSGCDTAAYLLLLLAAAAPWWPSCAATWTTPLPPPGTPTATSWPQVGGWANMPGLATHDKG